MTQRRVCAAHPDVEVRSLGCRRCHEPIALTWVEMRDGKACGGCGVPWVRTPWKGVPLSRLTGPELARLRAEERRYKEQHGDCGGFAQGVSGYLEKHCTMCCPPPPIRPATAQNIVNMLKAFGAIDGTVHS